MLVYANQLRLQGIHSEWILLRAIGRWLKEQLGYGLHPTQLILDGEHKGSRGELSSRLRIYSCYESEPALCSWVLKHGDLEARGRQWCVEVGIKKLATALEVSCVVKTDESSTLVLAPVRASQPRLVRYIIRDIKSSGKDASIDKAVPGQILKSIGEDRDSYRAFLYEIERSDRNAAIVLVSPTQEGKYLVDPAKLQTILIGLADVVQVQRDSEIFVMSDVLGNNRSAWDGAINVISIPSDDGTVRTRLFRSEVINDWGDGNNKISKVLALVTVGTNMPRLRTHIRPEGVRLLSVRRRMERMGKHMAKMETTELRQELEKATQQICGEETLFEEFAQENGLLHNQLSLTKEELNDKEAELWQKQQKINALQGQLSVSKRNSRDQDQFDLIHRLIIKNKSLDPRPVECLEIIECFYGDICVVLKTAQKSARKMSKFTKGRELFRLLNLLVTDYRSKLLDGGDSKARQVFGKNTFAPKESEPVTENKNLRDYRTFRYEGKEVYMPRHLKIGREDDMRKTIRVHFHWDKEREKIVIGYCGKHLPVPTH